MHDHDAFLIACYSEHPLVAQLRAELSQRGLLGRKLVLGIFEASILHALALVDSSCTDPGAATANRWGIVSTGKVWEGLLASGVERFLVGASAGAGAGAGVIGAQRFAGVATTGLNAIDLHTLPREEVLQSMKKAVRKLLGPTDGGGKVTAVCLGCAGMAGLAEAVNDVGAELGYPPGELRVIDGVKAGVLILQGLLKAKYIY